MWIIPTELVCFDLNIPTVVIVLDTTFLRTIIFDASVNGDNARLLPFVLFVGLVQCYLFVMVDFLVGKRMRPTLNLLIARALQSPAEEAAFLSDPPSPHNDNASSNASMSSPLPVTSGLVEGIAADHPVNTFNYLSKYQRQQRLAEITEVCLKIIVEYV